MWNYPSGSYHSVGLLVSIVPGALMSNTIGFIVVNKKTLKVLQTASGSMGKVYDTYGKARGQITKRIKYPDWQFRKYPAVEWEVVEVTSDLLLPGVVV